MKETEIKAVAQTAARFKDIELQQRAASTVYCRMNLAPSDTLKN